MSYPDFNTTLQKLLKEGFDPRMISVLNQQNQSKGITNTVDTPPEQATQQTPQTSENTSTQEKPSLELDLTHTNKWQKDFQEQKAYNESFKGKWNNAKNKAGKFLAENAQTISKVGGMVADAYINSKSNVESPEGFNAAINGVNGALDMASNIPGVGQYAAAAKGVVQAVQILDKGLGSHVDKYTVDQELMAQQGASYGDTFNEAMNLSSQSGKDYSLFNSSKAKKLRKDIAANKVKIGNIGKINNESLDYRARAEDPMIYLNYQSSLAGQPEMMVAKKGGILDRARKITKLQAITKPIQLETCEVKLTPVEEFKQGGTLHTQEEWDCIETPIESIQEFQKGGSINIIPEGALHARLHHIELDDITKKGIPVISESENGEIQQQAEIEHSEIIFRLEVTEKLEELKKKYEEDNKDDYAIEAGKLLVQEILYNTDDRTNLIQNTND